MKFGILFLLSLLASVGLSQHTTLSGVIQDEEEQPISGATVVLLNPTDSVLQHFAISNTEGHFEIKAPGNSRFLMQVSYLGFQTFYQLVETNDLEIEAGTIILVPEHKLLDEVIVTEDRLPIRIKGDTIEYDAGAFVTQPNAVVEDLFKKLPGVQVESDGTIKTQGKEVNKILVDGKEFFGEDPKIASKNLPSEAVDKVQVFDKKSDMAEFTGVDDGVRNKTINLELKDSHKNGSFGNISAGYGDQDRYNGKLNLNNFSKSTRLSFIGSSNNVNEQSFSINDYIMMNGGLGGFKSGRIRIELGGDDEFGLGGLQNGINTSYSAGINFNHEFSARSTIHASYFFNGLRNDLDERIQRQEFLLDGDLYSSSSTERLQHRYNHRLNIGFEQKLDSTQQIKLNSKISFNQFDQEHTKSNVNTDAFEALLNDSQRDQTIDGKRTSWNIDGAYRKKFNSKRGRFLALSGSFGNNTLRQDGLLNALNQFYQGVPVAILDTISQERQQEQDELNYQGRLSYTEPIGKKKYLELSAEHGNDQRDILQEVYDLIAAFPLKILDEDLTEAFDQSFVKTSGGLRYQQNLKKAQISLGGKYQQSKLLGKTAESIEQLEKQFHNFLPYMSFQYDFTSTNHMQIEYRTSIREPSLNQLQPLVENSDPLNVYIGNPALKPEYRHSISANYFSFSQFSGVNLFGSADVSYSKNKIINSRTIDPSFRQTIQPVNTDEAWQVFGSINFGAPIKPLKLRFNLSTNLLFDKYESELNNVRNPVETFNQSYRLRFDNRNKDHVDLAFGGRASWQKVTIEIGDAPSTQYKNQSYFIETSLNAIKHWRLEQSFIYNNWQGTAGAESQHTSIWNIGLSRYLFERRLQLKFQVVDALNQNQGLKQNTGINSIEFIQYRALGRYFMLSATYSLKKFGNNEPAITIERL